MVSLNRRNPVSLKRLKVVNFTGAYISDGQKLMLRAGIRKLKILEENFTRFASNKHPKMMVICELYGLSDVAVELAQVFSERLKSRMDVEQAIALLNM